MLESRAARLARPTTGTWRPRSERTWKCAIRAALRPARVADPTIRIVRAEQCYPALYRFLYGEVGRRYNWIDRLSWSDDEIRAHLAQPSVSIWLLLVRGTPAGYFELKADDEGGIEIAYFGLFEEFIGRGLGAHLLTEAVETGLELRAGPGLAAHLLVRSSGRNPQLHQPRLHPVQDRRVFCLTWTSLSGRRQRTASPGRT